MRIELSAWRMIRRLGLAAGLTLAAAAAQAQGLPPLAGPPPPVAVEAPPEARAPARTPRVRSEIRPYLEVAQVLSADFNGGDVLTYTTAAAGVDGRIRTRRVTAAMSYRYERRIGWNGDVPDSDTHSGVAVLNADIVPGLLDFDAGALATRTAGEGRAFGVTGRDNAVNVYSAYAGPTLSTHVGPVSVNAAYRLSYVTVDDDRLAGARTEGYDDSMAHVATASVGMGPGRLPVGWTVGAGYAREDSGGRFDQEYEAAYIRGDVVVPVSPTLALTAGVGYEHAQSTQLDIARDANGVPIIGPGGVTPDPSRPRLLAYDFDGLIYDAGFIWRPSSRTELQARAGRRYGGTMVTASLQHRFNSGYGLSAQVYDSVQTFNNVLVNDLSNLPPDFEIERNPLTGGLGLGGCVFGTDPGSGGCFDRSLQSISGNSFRLRGANLLFSGSRRLWSFGAGAGYSHRRYHRPDALGFAAFAPSEDETWSLYGNVGRRLSRTSEANFNLFASWFDSDRADFDRVFSTGATLSYRRSFLIDRLQLMAALGLYHSSDDVLDSTVGSGVVGLRYTF